MAQSGIFNILPTDYQLYLESMLPWMNEVPIGSEYFDTEMTDQIKDSVLNKYFNYNPNFGGGQYENRIGEMDYISPRYSMGHNDPNRLTGFNKLFNTLGSYGYKINPPAAGADPSVTITDRYDWNPDYGWRSDDKYGWKGSGDRGDVTTSMLAKKLWNQAPFRRRSLDLSGTAEMVGNYFGHRQSEGEGRDVNMTIPISNERWQSYQPNFVPQTTQRGTFEVPRNETASDNRGVGLPPRGVAGFSSGGIVSLVI